MNATAVAATTRAFGRARLAGDHVIVEAEPHVTIRLKRLFARADRQHGTLRLRLTDEIARDLLWFSERFPLAMLDADRRRLEERAETFDRRAATFAGLLSGTLEPRAFELAIPARRYQLVAAELLLQAGGLLIADDVGLGKTATSICALTDPRTRPALVVTLTHLPRQWERELARFAPGLRVHVIKKGQPYDVSRPPGRRRPAPTEQGTLIDDTFPDVLVVNYHKLAGWADVLAPKIRSVVFDEIQELRHAGSGKSAAARHIAQSADFRLGLSATPIYNYGAEFWNVLDVLRPGALGTREEFLREWCTTDSWSDDKARIVEPAAFGTYLRELGLMIRRTRAEVGRELPALTKAVHHIDADPKALDQVADAAAELARIILAREAGWEERGQASRELDWRLRQATGIAKAPYVAEFVRLLVESGERVVLYAWHREVYSVLMDRLKDCRPVLYTGTESPAQKERARDAFVAGEAQVLIMSLRSGAGLDGLQGNCRTVVFGELDWSPGVHEQCTGRVYRDGQPEPVVAYYLLAETGSDPIVADVLGVKRGQIEGVRDPDAPLVEVGADGDGIRRLAEGYLRQRGMAVPVGTATTCCSRTRG